MSETLDVGLKYEFSILEGSFSGLLHCYDPKTGYIVFRRVRDLNKKVVYNQYKVLNNHIIKLKLISDTKNELYQDYSAKREIEPQKRDRQTYLELHETPEHLKNLEEKQKLKITKANRALNQWNSSNVCQILIDGDTNEVISSTEILSKETVLSVHCSLCDDLSAISVLSVATEKIVFMYSLRIFKLGDLVDYLSPILENPSILKIIHDCRLFLYFVRQARECVPQNVFDTQLGILVVLKNLNNKRWPNVLGTLADCLEELRVRYPRNSLKSDVSRNVLWPLPKKFIESLSGHIMALFPLRSALCKMDLSGYEEAESVFKSYFDGCCGVTELSERIDSDHVLRLLSGLS